MKKTVKLLAFAAGAAALINHCIFKYANVRQAVGFDSSVYKWRHGRIRYVTAGKGEPVLLVHGLGAGHSLLEWEEQISRLSKDHRVYALDLLGFGASAKPNITYSAYLYASLINDFISDVIGTSANIVASAEGASFAIAASALKPELYGKMFLVSPAGISDSAQTPFYRLLRFLIDLPVLGTSIYNVLTSRAHICLRQKREGLSDEAVDKLYYSAHFGGVGNKYPHAARLSNFLSVRPGVISSVADMPIWICWGARNEANPLSNFTRIRSMNDNIGLTVFKDSGALPHKDSPDKFYNLCKEFFAD